MLRKDVHTHSISSQLNTIAQGAFGKVYEALGPTDPSDFKREQRSNILCIDQLTRVYAVKELPRSNRRAYEKEAQCHQAVSDCSGVLTLYHVVEEVDATYLVTVRISLLLRLSESPF